MANSFEYIIAGGGLAGLSLAFYLNDSLLRDKKTLIIDREAKDKNDRTWCFWEKQPGAFEEIVFRRWNGVWFHGTREFSEFLDLGEYQYKMIRAIDFYKFVFSRLWKNPNFTFLRAEIESVENAKVITDQGEFVADKMVFDSFTRPKYDDSRHQNLWQHFLGWEIETEKEAFDPRKPTLFDFRVEQNGECRFVYTLPFSQKKALVEFTVFSENLLRKNEYEENLRSYISDILSIENYTIAGVEKGVIPMSDAPHDSRPDETIVRIGTAGGFVKPSTGYSFQRAQRFLRTLVKSLENGSQSFSLDGSNWKSYLDSVLLNVLRTKKHSADDVFTCLFSKNPPSQVLKFLDEDTTLAEDLRIMKNVPLAAFTKAAAQTALQKLK